MPNQKIKCYVSNCNNVPTIWTEGADVMCDECLAEWEINDAFADFGY